MITRSLSCFLTQHWAEEVPKALSPDGKAEVTIWAGAYDQRTALPPPVNSWGSDPRSNLGIYYITIQPGGKFKLPGLTAARSGTLVNRVAYFIEGSALQINGEKISPSSSATLQAGEDAEFHNYQGGEVTEVLVLQGSPIGEPVAQHGPFVMNTMQEIQQAFQDYQRTQFGGWPWPQDAMVFPREKGRFALEKGVETRPPQQQQQQRGDDTCEAAST